MHNFMVLWLEESLLEGWMVWLKGLRTQTIRIMSQTTVTLLPGECHDMTMGGPLTNLSGCVHGVTMEGSCPDVIC